MAEQTSSMMLQKEVVEEVEEEEEEEGSGSKMVPVLVCMCVCVHNISVRERVRTSILYPLFACNVLQSLV